MPCGESTMLCFYQHVPHTYDFMLNCLFTGVRTAKLMAHTTNVEGHAGSMEMSIHVVEEDAVNPMESVGSAICHKAEQLDAAALVCMCGHKGPIQELFMGSVSSYLSHKSETPVLVLE